MQRAQGSFGTTAYDDLMEALKRLKQTSTIAAQKDQFEALSNILKGLLDTHKLSCFINGLKDEIPLPLHMFNPMNLSGLTRIKEEYLASTSKTLKPWKERSCSSASEGGHNVYSRDGSNRGPKHAIPIKLVFSKQMDLKKKKKKTYVIIVKRNGIPLMYVKAPRCICCRGAR